MSKERFDIRQHITDKIVSVIERGVGDFPPAWHRSAGGIMRPVDVASRKPHRGVNVVVLWAYADESSYSAGVWGTYRQWSEAGAQIRKGENATFVVFYKELEFAGETETGETETTTTRLSARATPVFPAEQVDGYQPPSSTHRSQRSSRRSSRPRLWFARPAHPSIRRRRAFCRFSTDSIQLPPREAFLRSPTGTPAEAYRRPTRKRFSPLHRKRHRLQRS